MKGFSPEEFYKEIHTGNPGDVDFYRRVVEGARHVLELGCGWGRITEALVADGRWVTGVDENRAFIDKATARFEQNENIHIFQHDVTQVTGFERIIAPPAGTSDRIIAPYNLLYALGGEAGVLGMFELARKCISEEGQLWCDVYAMDAMQSAWEAGQPQAEDDDDPVGEIEVDGLVLPVIERSTLDIDAQRLIVEYRAVQPNQEREASTGFGSRIQHDYLLLPQIERLLDQAGFELSLASGSFDGVAYDEDAELLVFCAEPR